MRDRLVVMLAYDLALRISELQGLEVADFRKDEEGEWLVTLRPEIQKGHKDEEVMYFFFDETKKLLEHYLKSIRKQFSPKATTEALILSNQKGRALSTAHCATRFKMLCQRFGVQTYYGKKPSPHTLRHTFATLNIETIGLCLPLYETAQRLRHSKVETTRRHYIHNNPYLKKLKMDAHRKNNKRKRHQKMFLMKCLCPRLNIGFQINWKLIPPPSGIFETTIKRFSTKHLLTKR